MERNLLYKESEVSRAGSKSVIISDKWSRLFPDATQNLVEYLIDGRATFSSYAKAIETAKRPGHYIYILGWMLDTKLALNGNQNLLQFLAAAAKRGVEIRVLIWNNPLYADKNRESVEALSKIGNTKIFIDDYTYTPPNTVKAIAGVQNLLTFLINKFAPFLLNPAARIKEQYNVAPQEVLYQLLYYMNTRNVGAHHEKILIVNGENGLISYCGGIDLNKNRISSYHDTACKVIGPEAHRVLSKFIKRWNNHGKAKSHPITGSKHAQSVKLGPIVGQILSAKVVGTYNSPDGKGRDRSLKEAYLKAISNANSYIYIEDQYLVNLDVAKELNKKIKENSFKKLIIVIQDSRETTDIMIPDRKRGEFFYAAIDGATAEQKKKLSLLMVYDDVAKANNRHPGLHSKTLIVDDELAIIGSANVNQRSFTLDSETSLVIFDHTSNFAKNNFAYKFRQSLWKDFMLTPNSVPGDLTWEVFPLLNVNAAFRISILGNYRNSIEDLDIRIVDKVKQLPPNLLVSMLKQIFGNDVAKITQAVSVLSNPVAMKMVFDNIWENIVDPNAN